MTPLKAGVRLWRRTVSILISSTISAIRLPLRLLLSKSFEILWTQYNLSHNARFLSMLTKEFSTMLAILALLEEQTMTHRLNVELVF